MAKLVTTNDNFEELTLSKPEKSIKTKEKEKKEKTKKREKKDKKEKNSKKGYFQKLMSEIKLVTWPTKKSLFKYSIATILMIILMAAFLIGVSAVFDLLYALVQGWIG